VITLLFIGFLGGLITGVSPCIIPVLPIIAAGGSTSENRMRPYAIIGGLVASFSVFTLVGGSLLSFLHLPQDFLRNLGIAVLPLLALGLLVPKVGELLERPFARLGGKSQSTSGSGFVLGLSLGLVFVPCAGPVLAAITVVAATHRVGFSAVLLTAAYAIGAAVPMLAIALLTQRAATTWASFKSHIPVVRQIAGAVLALTALAIAFNLTRPLQTSVPGYTSALENHLEGSGSAKQQLQAITGEQANKFTRPTKSTTGSLPNLGQAPDFHGITQWLNTPGNRPLTLQALRGKVVLIDFWTYSCINCLRALPHVEAWYAKYKSKGLVVVGVHTPEFPFEYVVSNVRAASSQLDVMYPVAIDDKYGTWDAYNNQYWPAEYLIDQNGAVRHTNFGEGDYANTEADIRQLLATGGAHLTSPTRVADKTPTEAISPETYLGYDRFNFATYSGTAIQNNKPTRYQMAAPLPTGYLTLGGTWNVGSQSATAGSGAGLELNFQARNVYLVLGGTGTVGVSVNGTFFKTVDVAGVPNLYTLESGALQSGNLQLTFSPGVQAFDFTFG
jgi:cytochrome c biogenesis protein CcdA/thiol-disulfide isomerase/thioredoxin